ncbi:MAG: hypothetical protein JW795_19890, partial [Chitinivibrionales bacterium]|nr:hypothetical protein [Chitinivibrionales bacterium]
REGVITGYYYQKRGEAMIAKRWNYVFMCLFVALFSVTAATSFVGNPKTAYTLKNDQLQNLRIVQSFTSQHEQVGTSNAIDYPNAIFGMGVNASIKLHNDAGLARVILIDQYNEEYLVYEVYSLLVDDYAFSVQNAAFETKILDGVVPKSYRVELLNASFDLQSFQFVTQPPVERLAIADMQTQIQQEQVWLRVDLLNTQIKKKGFTWTAGITEVGSLPYAKKRCMFNGGEMLGNTQGFEYHIDGVFNLKSNDPESDAEAARMEALTPSSMISSFDWRPRHGATSSQSPYFNKASKGSTDGWLSPVKNQGQCGSCWAHSTCSAAEAVANLYFNQHLGIDLSEQYIMECGQGAATAGKGCGGGFPSKALKWAASHGVIDEASMPYTGSDAGTCADTSNNPKELLRFTSSVTVKSSDGADAIKKALIKYGPMNVAIKSLSHAMALVAYNSSNWVFKNSWGPSNQAYKTIALGNISDIVDISGYNVPVSSKIYSEKDIKCLDADKDGYYNWGIGPKPSTCPGDITAEEDCDDSNNKLGPMGDDGACKPITTGIVLHTLKNSGINYNCIRNPLDGSTLINIQSPNNAVVAVKLFAMSGALIKTLSITAKQDGVQAFWDYTNECGGSVSNGVYLCRIITSSKTTAAAFNSFKVVVSR